MTVQGTHRLLDIDGPAAPPRSNGELVFAEPWESRAFGLAMALHDAGFFVWEEFRQQLIKRIAAWERDHPPGECWSYYRCWMQALEDLVVDRGLLNHDEVTSRTYELAARPSGHDHDDAGPEHGGQHSSHTD